MVSGDFLPLVEVFERLKVSDNFIIQDYSFFSFQAGLQMVVNSTIDDMTLMGCHLKPIMILPVCSNCLFPTIYCLPTVL
jgi:hypothetical protein